MLFITAQRTYSRFANDAKLLPNDVNKQNYNNKSGDNDELARDSSILTYGVNGTH